MAIDYHSVLYLTSENEDSLNDIISKIKITGKDNFVKILRPSFPDGDILGDDAKITIERIGLKNVITIEFWFRNNDDPFGQYANISEDFHDVKFEMNFWDGTENGIFAFISFLNGDGDYGCVTDFRTRYETHRGEKEDSLPLLYDENLPF